MYFAITQKWLTRHDKNDFAQQALCMLGRSYFVSNLDTNFKFLLGIRILSSTTRCCATRNRD